MCGKWFVAMSRINARAISSSRMRRCSQRRKSTNCTPTGTSADKMAFQCVGMGQFSNDEVAAVGGAACCAPTRNMKAAASRRTPKLEKRAGQTAERATESRPERGKESTAAARGVGARVEQFRRDAERAPEQIRVHAEEARKALQRGHLALKSGVGKGELVLLRLACRGNSLLARELVGEIGKAGGIARACQTVLRRLLQRIECAGQRALRLPGHRGFVSGAQTGIVQDALKLREKQIPNLLLIAQQLLVQRVDAGELFIRQLAWHVLRKHGNER